MADPLQEPMGEMEALRAELRLLNARLREAEAALDEALADGLRRGEEIPRLHDDLAARSRALFRQRALLGSQEAEIKAVRALLLDAERRASEGGNEEALRTAIEELQVSAEELEELNEQLRESNALLDRRVAERTAELSAANARLERAWQEAEAANAEKTRFLAAASHDLRQPLQGIQTLARLLLERTAGDADANLLARHLESAVRSASALLNARLDVSRLDAGLVEPRRRAFPIRELLAQIATETAGGAEAKGLRFGTVGCAAFVESDPALLDSILRNLVANAVRYTKRGRILLGCRRRGAMLRIEVWDTGIGIPPDQLELVFEDFRQIGNPERDREKGLGLGLAVVNRLAKLLGHEVGVRSTPGRGSVFWVAVPRAVPAPARPAAARGEPARLAGKTVVLVEDDWMQLQALEILLSDWECRVVAARSAAEAEAAIDAAGLAPDLLLSDLRLQEGRSGFEAVERLRVQAGRQVPAVLLTGDTGPAVAERARAADCLLLHKPYDVDRLRQVLGEAAAGCR